MSQKHTFILLLGIMSLATQIIAIKKKAKYDKTNRKTDEAPNIPETDFNQKTTSLHWIALDRELLTPLNYIAFSMFLHYNPGIPSATDQLHLHPVTATSSATANEDSINTTSLDVEFRNPWAPSAPIPTSSFASFTTQPPQPTTGNLEVLSSVASQQPVHNPQMNTARLTTLNSFTLPVVSNNNYYVHGTPHTTDPSFQRRLLAPRQLNRPGRQQDRVVRAIVPTISNTIRSMQLQPNYNNILTANPPSWPPAAHLPQVVPNNPPVVNPNFQDGRQSRTDLPAVQLAVINRIQMGDFINFDSLLPGNIGRPITSSISLNIEGDIIQINNSDPNSRHSRAKVIDIFTWTLFFFKFCKLTTATSWNNY